MNRNPRRRHHPVQRRAGVAVAAVAAVAAALVTALAARPAVAGVPDPRFCAADTCLVLSPSGAFLYTVTLRDESFAPVPSTSVVIDFVAAPGIALCDSSDPDHDGRVTALTDAQGRADFYLRGGGTTSGYAVVSALGQTLRAVYPRSPDLSGNLTVGAEDTALHSSLPLASRAGDYDCDGDSDAADRTKITLQMGQDCGTVEVLSSTWGRLKGLYR